MSTLKDLKEFNAEHAAEIEDTEKAYALLFSENGKLKDHIEQLERELAETQKDAERYRWLNKLTWTINPVRTDGNKLSKADKFAIGFTGNLEDITSEWSVSFFTDYGMNNECEDDLSLAIYTAIQEGK